ncbi:hypothetical protein GCM10009731_25660 [Streptomyces globosus]
MPTISPLSPTDVTVPPVHPSGSGTAWTAVPFQYTGMFRLVPTARSPRPRSYTVPRSAAGPEASASRLRISGVQLVAPAGAANVTSPATAAAAATAAVVFLIGASP